MNSTVSVLLTIAEMILVFIIAVCLMIILINMIIGWIRRVYGFVKRFFTSRFLLKKNHRVHYKPLQTVKTISNKQS